MVLEQTKRCQRGNMGSIDLELVGYKAERGFGKNEENQMPQRSQTFLGTQGQRSEDQVHWQNRKNFGSHKKEVSTAVDSFLSLT
jgi:hypothetical protein